MLSRTQLTALSSAERQLLHRQWQQSGQCIRCFHASIRRRADEGGSSEGNDQGTPYNKPQRGPTRHQRAAQISAEVRALNRDVPSIGPSQPPNDSPDFAVGPQGTGELGIPGRMGENMPPQREGIYGQGASRNMRSREDEEVGVRESQNIRGVRDPSAGVEDPSQGGASVLGDDSEMAVLKQEMEAAEADVYAEAEQPVAAPSTRFPAPGKPFNPRQPTFADLSRSGSGTSTIAASNFSGVLADRLHLVASPGEIANASEPRDIDMLARKLLNGRSITHLHSPEVKAAVLAKADEIRGYKQQPREQEDPNIVLGRRERKMEEKTRNREEFLQRVEHMTDEEKAELRYHPDQNEKADLRDAKMEANPAASERKGSRVSHPLPEGVRKSLVDSMVRGVYDAEGVLGGEKYKQPVLNTVARAMVRNGTFLGGDAERLLQKVRSLLPVAAPARTAGPRKPAAST